MFGYGLPEVLGQPVSMLMPQPYRRDHDTYMDRYLDTGVRRIIGIGREVVAQRRDGTSFPIDLSVGEFVSEGEHGFVGILRDISVRKRQEAELRKTTEELRLIFEHTPTAIAITDLEGCIVDANRGCEALLGYPASELRGRLYATLLADEDREAVTAELAHLQVSGELLSREQRYCRADGQQLVALLNAGVARDVDGAPLLTICEIVDRSQLYAATHEAEDLRAKLAYLNRLGTLGEMVSGIAHEVNQPLTAIASYASAARRFLLAGSYDSSELASILEKISAQAERAGQVIRRLRNMTRRHEEVREPLDVKGLVVEVARLIGFEFSARGWRLLLKLDAVLPRLLGDTVQIQQVLLNLIRNAVEAMSEQTVGDKVEVMVSSPDPATVEIHVIDSGPGLSKEIEDRLFEPFFTTKSQGMGLGLSICRSIMAAHGGDLSFRRRAHGGAEFVMSLPVNFQGAQRHD